MKPKWLTVTDLTLWPGMSSGVTGLMIYGALTPQEWPWWSLIGAILVPILFWGVTALFFWEQWKIEKHRRKFTDAWKDNK